MRLKAKDHKGHDVGEYICMEDGYYVYSPDHENGVDLNESSMFFILLQLRRLNLQWDTQFMTDPLVCGKELE